MKNLKPKLNFSNYNVRGYTQGTPVKITKGSNKDCQGKISGCTIDGVYFIRIDKCQREVDQIRNPIDLFLPDEFEPLDSVHTT